MKNTVILLAVLVGCGVLFLRFRTNVSETCSVGTEPAAVERSTVPGTLPSARVRAPRTEAVVRDRMVGTELPAVEKTQSTDAENPVASVLTLPNGRTMRVLKRTGAVSKPNASEGGNAVDGGEMPAGMELPPAIRLSEDFKLPAVVMALSEGALAERSPQVRQAAENVEKMFYQELAEELAKERGWQEKLAPDPETGEPTLVVEQSPATERVRSRANERFRLLFGDLKYNAYSLRTAVERVSASTGKNGH